MYPFTTLDDPKTVPTADANYLQNTDYVLGITAGASTARHGR